MNELEKAAYDAILVEIAKVGTKEENVINVESLTRAANTLANSCVTRAMAEAQKAQAEFDIARTANFK